MRLSRQDAHNELDVCFTLIHIECGLLFGDFPVGLLGLLGHDLIKSTFMFRKYREPTWLWACLSSGVSPNRLKLDKARS